MTDYRIELTPSHNEIAIGGTITTGLIRRIMEELRTTPGFPDRHAIWVFENGVTPPPYPEFAPIAEAVRGALHGASPDKRVALVVQRGLNRALVEMFRTDAVGFGFAMRVFTSRAEALAWIGEVPGPA